MARLQYRAMRSRLPFRRCWLTALLAVVCLGRAAAAHAAVEHASVLILLPGQPGLPAATAVAGAVRDVLLTEWSLRVTIEMEHVDVARYASPEMEEHRLRTVYHAKYGPRSFDVIIAALPEPFRFVLRARDELWPGTPVVVCGVDERNVRDVTPPPGFTIRTIRFDMDGTVRLARALLPETRHVALVGGASAPEQRYHDMVRQAVSAAGGLDLIDLTTLPMADVLARVSRLPERTVVVQSSYQVDATGRRFYGIDLVPHVSNAANRPVFTPLGLALGRGVVGGSILEFDDIGRDAGAVASRLLRGEPMPPGPTPSAAVAVPRFDGRQLARWHLDEGRLPPGSRVDFPQPGLWREYRWHVVGAGVALAAQMALIVTLLVQRRQRREAQAVTGDVLAALSGETAIIDSTGTIVQVNEAWAATARTEALPALAVGANYLEACGDPTDMPLDIARTVRAATESVLRGERDEFAVEYPASRHGEGRWFEVRVRRLPRLGKGAAVTHFDVTARRQAEAAARRHLAQMAHLDRVAGMGQLASSLAHELNQPLAAILTNAQAANRLLATVPPDMAELRACLEDIVTDDQRAAEVIHGMRRLLKKTDLVASVPVALNDLVTTTIGLVGSDALLHAVSVEFTPAAGLPAVHGDRVQIQQVVLNLLTNAITAASAGATAGTVAVWTSTAAPWVEVGVHDSGPGIKDGDLARLFEPFFTTREEGLGMGLAISRAIVEAHGGRLVAENHPASGAIFRVQLPIDRPTAA